MVERESVTGESTRSVENYKSAAAVRKSWGQTLSWWIGWTLPLLLILLALWSAATAGLTHTYYSAATGVAGELLAGHSVGQTFRAQHDGLDGVDLRLATYARSNPGDVVLHLRQDVTHTIDLATVRVPAAGVKDNDWHHFAFPPISHSRGQYYYIELEQPGAVAGQAVTAYWALDHGDLYPYGRATYDRAPRNGDLSFGLHYDPPLATLWADLVATYASQVPGWLPLLLLGAACAAVGLLVLLIQGTLRGWFAGRGWRTALAGTLLTALAAAHGLVYMLAVPPWQGPDEFAHYAYTVLLAADVDPADSSLVAQRARARIESQVLAAMDAHDFTRTISWADAPGGPAADFITRPVYGGSTMFLETRQPALYYQLAALPLRAYAADPVTIPPDIGLYLVRATSVFWNSLVVLLAWLAMRVVSPQSASGFRIVALPVTLALLPMHTFINSMANNDVLAELVVTALVVLVFAWLTRMRPLSTGGVVLALLGALVGGAGLAVKTTTAAAAAGLGLGGLVGAAGVMIGRLPEHRRRVVRVTALIGLIGGGVALVATGAGSFEHASTVQAWSTLFGQRATRVVTTDAHEGQSVLRLQARQTVFQRVDLPPMHPAYRLEFQAWTRPAPDDPAGQGWARIDAGSIPISQTEGLLAGSQIWPGWQPITATAVISPDIPFVNCELGADGAAEFDDVVLLAYPLAAPGRPPATAVAVPLRNPSMEDAGVQLQPDTLLGWLVAHMPTTLQAGLILDTLANPQPFDKTAVAGSYLENAAKSYWGWFGWLSVPLELPAWQYWLWLGLTLAALAGGIGAIVTRPHPKTAQIALVLVSLGALGIAAGAVGARQMMQLAQYGLRDFPQGRHLFVLSLPTTWLLLGGLAWWPSWLARRLPPVARRHTTLLMRTMGWLGLLLLLYLDLYALIVLLIPYYYGRF